MPSSAPYPRARVAAPVAIRALLAAVLVGLSSLSAQVTTGGFPNAPRAEAPGTLLSHPVANGSEPIGRTTSLNYLNGWLVVGGEVPGSRPGSDLVMRVYDVSDPAAPVARVPSDFGLSYANDRWYQGNVGFNAHGTAQTGDLLVPAVLRVQSFGGPVEMGGTNGIPDLGQVGIGYNRSSQAGPWVASFPWYGSADQDFTIQRVDNSAGWNQFQTLATFDHVGAYGGGDWHPMFFGDLLIYARSGSTARDGVVVYRLQYNDFDDEANRSVTPQFVGSLSGGFEGYWPTFFSDGSGLYVVGSSTDILMAADISPAADPAGDGRVSLAASLTVPGFSNATYPAYQDQFGFIHNRKVDMTRFLAGDPNPVVLTLDEGAPNFVNTSQMSLPLGNLWVTGGYPINHGSPDYRAQGMAVWVHQQAPDTTPPRVSFHIPQVNRSNYPRHAPLSFLIHEHTRAGGPRNGTDFLVRPVLPGDTLGAAVPGYLIHDFSGVLTFTPEGGLEPDTTYQVDFPSDLSDPQNPVGFVDTAGNAIEPYSFRFATGSAVDASPPPEISGITADTYQPAPGEELTVSVTATGTAPLEYRFNFDGTWSAWSGTPSLAHTYPASGRPRVLVQVRDADGQLTNGSLNLLVLTPPPAGPRPTSSSSMAVGDDPSGRRLWVVNPDADSIAVLDAASGTKLAEHSTGTDPRSVARDHLGRYWLTCHDADEIRVLAADGSLVETISLPYGSAPFGVAASPDGQSLFVTLQGSARLQRYDANAPQSPPVEQTTFPTPRAIAVSGDGTRVFVTRFLSPELSAEVAEFAGTSPGLDHVRTIALRSANTLDGGDRAAGVPNYLTAIAISPDGTRAAVASKQDNIQRGQLFGVADLTHETTVRAVVSFLDLTTNEEIRDTRRDFDNSDSPSALAYTPLGDTLLVALQGNNKVVGMDTLSLAPTPGYNVAGSTFTSPAVLSLELATGPAPQGLLLDPVGGRLYSQDFMGRSVTVRDAGPLLTENRTSLPVVATTNTVATELLAPDVLLGKQVFYNAADPRMSADSYISCATCHLDGGHDGRVWDFTGRGEGLRRTTDLRGRSGTGHGNVHWSANFDEIQDFAHDIRGPFGGTGFLPLSPGEFARLHPSPASGKSGLSPELDALAAYVRSLGPAAVPRSPQREPDGSLGAASQRGRAVFDTQDCASCHGGEAGTSSAVAPISTALLQDVGTTSLLSGRRLGGPLAGIDPPTLHGLHASRVYLHHGQATSLEDVFSQAGGRLLTAADAELVGLGAGALDEDNPDEGGGGFLRGVITGTAINLTGASGNGVRFTNVDGGTAGGTAQLQLRYAKNYGGTTATFRLNGDPASDQSLTLLRQTPDNSWMTSGWRWLTIEADLLPGPVNTLEILRGPADFRFNVLLVSNADDLAVAGPHRRVLALPAGDRDDLIAYLRAFDGRDDSGTPLADPAATPATAPGILTPPVGTTLAEGNPLALFVAVSGTGPFTFQWSRDGVPVGTDSPFLDLPAVTTTDSGNYSVEITNASGSATSTPTPVVVNPALAITTESLPRLTVGRSYSIALAADGGIDARTWSLDGPPLPSGLSLSAAGVLSGTPVAPALALPVFRVTDSSGTATRTISLEVRPQGGFVDDPDLVLHYTFDELAGNRVWDAAGGGNDHSTDLSGAQWTTDGRFGGAYGADLTSDIPRFFPANQGDLDFDPQGEEFTISLWVRTTTSAGYRTLLGKDGHAAENWQPQYRLWTTGSPGTVQGITGGNWSGQLATGLNDGQWHLVTLVNFPDGGTWRSRVYYDDASSFTQWNSGATTVPQQLRIGDTSHGGNGWRGQIDDLRIYRRALSPAEIADLHSPPAAMNYDTWTAGLPAPLPPGLDGPLHDADFDGLLNLLEYALGGDPLSGASLPAPTVIPPTTPGDPVRFDYLRARPDLIYTVERSPDLQPGSWTTSGVTQDTTTPVGGTAQATTSPGPSGSLYLRLVVRER